MLQIFHQKLNVIDILLKLYLLIKKSKLDNLVKHDCIEGNPEELADLSLHEWNEENLL